MQWKQLFSPTCDDGEKDYVHSVTCAGLNMNISSVWRQESYTFAIQSSLCIQFVYWLFSVTTYSCSADVLTVWGDGGSSIEYVIIQISVELKWIRSFTPPSSTLCRLFTLRLVKHDSRAVRHAAWPLLKRAEGTSSNKITHGDVTELCCETVSELKWLVSRCICI